MIHPAKHPITVVGLGPADTRLITDETTGLLLGAAPGRVWLRTRIHPAASLVPSASTFDHVYEQEPTFDAVYRRIAAELETLASSSASDDGPLIYAVPGSPVVAEHTVELLLANPSLDVTVVPAMSFLDLAWARLRIDPVAAAVRLLDGHRFALDAADGRGAALVAQCHDRHVLSDIKLSIDDAHPERLPKVTVLHHLGLPDERVVDVEWNDLDRMESDLGLRVDHLSSVYIPQLASPTGRAFVRIEQQMRTLRVECPWDREQTHASLARYAVEEAYELADSITDLGAGDEPSDVAIEHLCEELGDLLLQVVFHACLAEEQGWFSFADVADALHDKLERRHPHVFGGVHAATAEEVTKNWAAIKADERRTQPGNDDAFSAIADSLPALSWASKVVKVAGNLGAAVPRAEALPGSIGERLLAVVVDARREGLDPETELRRAALLLRESSRERNRSAGNDMDESKRT